MGVFVEMCSFKLYILTAMAQKLALILRTLSAPILYRNETQRGDYSMHEYFCVVDLANISDSAPLF